MSEELTFRVDTLKLLNEIADCAMPREMGILKVPLNIFRILLAQATQRAIELNDPKLNICMLNLGLYDVPPQEVAKRVKEQELLIKE